MIYGLKKGAEVVGGYNETDLLMNKYLELALKKGVSWGEDEAKKC